MTKRPDGISDILPHIYSSYLTLLCSCSATHGCSTTSGVIAHIPRYAGIQVRLETGTGTGTTTGTTTGTGSLGLVLRPISVPVLVLDLFGLNDIITVPVNCWSRSWSQSRSESGPSPSFDTFFFGGGGGLGILSN